MESAVLNDERISMEHPYPVFRKEIHTFDYALPEGTTPLSGMFTATRSHGKRIKAVMGQYSTVRIDYMRNGRWEPSAGPDEEISRIRYIVNPGNLYTRFHWLITALIYGAGLVAVLAIPFPNAFLSTIGAIALAIVASEVKSYAHKMLSPSRTLMNDDQKIEEFHQYVMDHTASLKDPMWNIYEAVTNLAEQSRHDEAMKMIKDTKCPTN